MKSKILIIISIVMLTIVGMLFADDKVNESNDSKKKFQEVLDYINDNCHINDEFRPHIPIIFEHNDEPAELPISKVPHLDHEEIYIPSIEDFNKSYKKSQQRFNNYINPEGYKFEHGIPDSLVTMVILSPNESVLEWEEFAKIKTNEGTLCKVEAINTPSTFKQTKQFIDSLKRGSNPKYPKLKYLLIGSKYKNINSKKWKCLFYKEESVFPDNDVICPYEYHPSDLCYSYDKIKFFTTDDKFDRNMNSEEFSKYDLIVGRVPAYDMLDVRLFSWCYNEYYDRHFSDKNKSLYISSAIKDSCYHKNGEPCVDPDYLRLKRLIPLYENQFKIPKYEYKLTSPCDLYDENFDYDSTSKMQGLNKGFSEIINKDDYDFININSHGFSTGLILRTDCKGKDEKFSDFAKKGKISVLTNSNFDGKGVNTKVYGLIKTTNGGIINIREYDKLFPKNKETILSINACNTMNPYKCIEFENVPCFCEDLWRNRNALFIFGAGFLEYEGTISYFSGIPYLSHLNAETSLGEVIYQLMDKYQSRNDDVLKAFSQHEVLGRTIFGDPSMWMWTDYHDDIDIRTKNTVPKSKDLILYTCTNNSTPINANMVIYDANNEDKCLFYGKGEILLHDVIENDTIKVKDKYNIYLSKKNYRKKKIVNYQLDKPLPYKSDFNKGFDSAWYLEGDSLRVKTEPNITSTSSDRVMIMSSVDSIATPLVTHADLHLNLSQKNRVYISFDYLSSHNKYDKEDGVYVSNDRGDSWHKIYDFDIDKDNVWRSVSFNLDTVMDKDGLDYSSIFIFRFQHKGIGSFKHDGIALRNIRIREAKATPLYKENFEKPISGVHANNYWKLDSEPLGLIYQGNKFDDEGNNTLTMCATEKSYDQTLTKADLYVDLSESAEKYDSYVLRYSLKHYCDYNDECHENDGIYLSDDDGYSFKKIHSFDYSTEKGSWNVEEIDLGNVIRDHHLQFNDHFIIQVRQRSYYIVPNDGISIDNVKIYGLSIKSYSNEQVHENNDSLVLKAFPNPFNPSTRIAYTLSKDSHATINIFNIKGQKICTLINEEQKEGYHSVVWNGTNNNNKRVASGVYFYKLTTEYGQKTNKFVLLK